MVTARSSRSSLPTPGALGIESPRAAQDFEELGWNNPEKAELLWALGGVGDPTLALNNLMRLKANLADKWPELDQALSNDLALRVRLFALLGGSSALGDHLVANPNTWHDLTLGIPSSTDMMHTLLTAIQATPAQVRHPDAPEEIQENASPAASQTAESGNDTDSADAADSGGSQVKLWQEDTANEFCSSAGTYRAGLTGRDAETALKLSYRSLITRIAAHDLAGTYPDSPRHPGQPTLDFETVAHALSDLADAALTAALAVAVTKVYGDAPLDGRLAIIALGKCGARELNYISDVDIIFVCDDPGTRTSRLAAEMMRIGSVCFFEVDAALRPEGKRGALVRTLESYETYYKRWAHTWEFQAQLKARPMTGDRTLAQEYIAMVSPMVWTASQRESFVEDVQKMRKRVIDHVPEALKDRELKLGRGGLRDVEFAVQLMQMVHGRADESLRVTATLAALRALVAGGYVGREDAQKLIESYEFLRLLEHRLQLQRMRRTHTMPEPGDTKGLRWLSRASGIRLDHHPDAVAALADTYKAVRRRISTLHQKLFFRPLLESVVSMPVETLRLSPESAKRQLAVLGYRFPDRAYEHLISLASGATRKAKIQAMLLPTLMEWLSTTADPDAGLLNYRKLSEAAEDRQWFLRMLRDEGVVGQRLMKILGNSNYAASLIISTPDVVKQLGDGAQGPKLLDSSEEAISRSLIAVAARHEDPDRAITVARGLRRAELARIASASLLGLMDERQVCRGLSAIWCAVLDAALSAEIAASTGDEPAPAKIAVIGMGRLGGMELGFGSDADVMFVCQPTPGATDTEETEAIKWAIGICDRMRTRLAKPSGDPPLEVDLGLRPEGRSGAVVRTLDSYQQYYSRWGETWEIQALLRAAPIAGDPELGAAFIEMIDQFRYPVGGVSPETVREVRRMKARVDNERLPRGADPTTHTKLGRGALTDVEWTVQLLTLEHAHQVPALHTPSTLDGLEALAESGLVASQKIDRLRSAWLLATKARNALVLVKGKRADQLPAPGPQLAQVAAAAGWDPDHYQEFLEHYLKTTRKARVVIDEIFWGEADSQFM